MSSALVELFGPELLTKNGIVSTEQVLSGKSKIGIYFSAHWCGPCRGFTPVAAESYKSLKEHGESGFEVVFVSADQDQESFDSYFGEMPWVAIPFDKLEDFKDNLDTKFNVRGIPQLSIVDSDGAIVTNNGRELIGKYGKSAYPFTAQHVESLASEQRKKSASVIQILSEKHFPTLLGGAVDNKVQYILIILAAPDKDRAVEALSNMLPTLEQTHPEMVIRYVPWLDETSPAHKTAAGAITMIPAGSLNAENRKLIGDALGSEVEPAQLMLLGRGAGGTWELAAADAWRPIMRLGLKGYPWTDAAVAAAEAAEAARVEALGKTVARLGHLKTAGRSTLQRGVGGAAAREEVDALADGNEVVGLYFSASWCGPCQGFTPELRRVYEELRGDGKRFEVVFVSADRSQEDFDAYYAKMPWLALPYDDRELQGDLNRLYGVRGIPTLVLLNPKDGSVISADGTEAVSYGAGAWPFDAAAMAKGAAEAEARERRKREEALAAEAAALAAQEAAPGPKAVVRRWRGPAGSATVDAAKRTVAVTAFTTVAVPGCPVPPGGRAYYEIDVTECQSIVQVGWATKALGTCDEATGEGVGDAAGSWGADGVRQVKWDGGKTEKFGGEWKAGDTIGLAVWVPSPDDPAAGGVFVSYNGSFEAPYGLLAAAAALAAAGPDGVFAALTSSPGFAYTYNFGEAAFKHSPPTPDYKPLLAFYAA